MSSKCLSIIGLGYIGLPTAAVIASRKQKVVGVDVAVDTVDTINAGKVHIIEPGLELLVKEGVKSGFLNAVTSPEPADAFLISVPTPFLGNTSEDSLPKPDISYIESASKSVAKVLKRGDIVILESTSPVGTTEQMSVWLSECRPDLTFPHTHGEESDIRVAYCPERVLPGNVIKELVENDRIIGGLTEKCSQAAIEIYKIFVEGICSITDARTAEMAKLTENSSRDVGIAFANELSIICDNLDIDVWELISLANRHPRVNILQPGPGVGGHCIAVDPWFIVSSAPLDARLITIARTVNDSKPDWVVEKVKVTIADILKSDSSKSASDLKIACYGLAFKPNIDDLRESPAVLIAQRISELHPGHIIFVEPHVEYIPEELGGGTSYDFMEALLVADIHLLLVDHDIFNSRRPEQGAIIDTKGIWTDTK